MTRRLPWRGAVALLVVAAVVAGVVWFFVGRSDGRLRVRAQFTSAVGLYAGDSVRVLGVPVGTVTGVHARGTYVEVDMRVDRSVPVAATTGAVIVPPGVISSRYVQLTAPWTTGPKLASGATIDVHHTGVPLEVDDVTRQLDALLVALGPDGANSTGALSQLVSTSAAALAGNGAGVRDSLTNVAKALDTLGSSSDDIVSTLENLQTFATAIAGSDQAVRLAQQELATVSTQLAGERTQLASTISGLSTAVQKVNAFVAANKDALTTDISQLSSLSATLAEHQRDLEEVLDLTPIGTEAIFGSANLSTETLDARTDLLDPAVAAGPTSLCQLLQGVSAQASAQVCSALTTPLGKG